MVFAVGFLVTLFSVDGPLISIFIFPAARSLLLQVSWSQCFATESGSSSLEVWSRPNTPKKSRPWPDDITPLMQLRALKAPR